MFIRMLASRIAQNQNFFGSFATVRNEQAILVSDSHLRSTNLFLF